MTYRVVQWTTDNVGRRSVHAIANSTDLASSRPDDEPGRKADLWRNNTRSGA